MTHEALIEKVAKLIWERDPQASPYCWMKYRESNYLPMAKDVLEALDLKGILDDLRFYGDAYSVTVVYHNYPEERSHSVIEDDGQRARTRLSSLGTTNNGGNDE